MGYYIREFRSEDAEGITTDPLQQSMIRIYDQFPGISAIDVDTGQVLSSGGVIISRKGFGEVWSIITPESAKHPFSVVKEGKRMVESIAMLYKLRRVQGTVMEGFDVGHKFIRLLGFHLENWNPMKNYGLNGESYYMYVRLF